MHFRIEHAIGDDVYSGKMAGEQGNESRPDT
jgi:hypothetical protein